MWSLINLSWRARLSGLEGSHRVIKTWHRRRKETRPNQNRPGRLARREEDRRAWKVAVWRGAKG